MITDWTLTTTIPEGERELHRAYVEALARRDFEGISECDVFALLSEPADGRSMYVELGLALALHESRGRPAIFVIGPSRSSSDTIFYYHPAVCTVSSVDEMLQRIEHLRSEPTPELRDGRIEEYRALRAEMLQIINDRIWGQATYAVLAAGALAFSTNSVVRVPGLVFLTGIALPFLAHTMWREHARIRMGNYLRAVLEPTIPGMHWEEHLRVWRTKFGDRETQGWLTRLDRAKHIFALSGLFLMISVFSFGMLFSATRDLGPLLLASLLLAAVLTQYWFFFRLYDKGDTEYQKIAQLWPRG